MDKIKFRAWDKETEEFIYSDKDDEEAWFEFKDGTLRAFALHGMDAGTIHESPQPICDELELPQMFTDFKDKNDCGIYQGDLMESMGRVWEVCRGKQTGAWVLMAPKSDKRLRGYDIMLLANVLYVSEIVGHIHQKPKQ